VSDECIDEVVEGGTGAPGRVPMAVLGVVDLDKLAVAVGLALNREVAAPIILGAETGSWGFSTCGSISVLTVSTKINTTLAHNAVVW
jgi:hypothetical protein